MYELPFDIKESDVTLMLQTVEPSLILMLCNCMIKFRTGLLPSKVGVHLIKIQRGPELKEIMFIGGSGGSEIKQACYIFNIVLEDSSQ